MFRQSRRRCAAKTIRPHARRMFLEPLEDRRVLAGDLAGVATLISQDNSGGESAHATSPVLVFVDSAVAGYQDLVRNVIQPADAANVDVVAAGRSKKSTQIASGLCMC